MSEYYIHPSRQKELTAEKLQLDKANAEKERLVDSYNDLNATRLNCEQDGLFVANFLKKALFEKASANRTSAEQAKIDKYKAYFELDESTLAAVEEQMADTERLLGFGPENSRRFDEVKNDVLVNSAIFYHERIDALKNKTDNQFIDEGYINSVIAYARSVEYDTNPVTAARFDDIAAKQEWSANCGKARSRCHNEMITQFNKLNDAAKENDLIPLTYRNLITNSSVNDYKNNAQMYHDRVTLARYTSEVIHTGYDIHSIDANVIENVG